MNKKLLIALPFVAAMSVGPAMAGNLGAPVRDPVVHTPVHVESGGMSNRHGILIAVVGVAALAALAASSGTR